MKKVTKLAAAILVATTSMLALTAQSNTNKATAGTIRADQDNYNDLNYFNEVQFNKAFAFTNLSDGSLQLGGATKVNDIYLGGYYSGNLWGNLQGHNNKEEIKNSTLSYKETDIYSNTGWNKHYFNVLIGLKNMGFSIDTYLKFDGTDKKNTYDKTVDIGTVTNQTSSSNDSAIKPTSSSKEYNNNYKVNFGWGGMTFGSEKTIIKPTAFIGLDYYDRRTNSFTKEVNKELNNDNQQYINNSIHTIETKSLLYSVDTENYLNNAQLQFRLGSDFILGNNTNFKQIVNASYGIDVNLTPKDYYTSIDKNVDYLNENNNKTVKTVKSIDGRVELENLINTSYRFEYKPVEALTLGLRANLDTTVNYFNPGTYVTTTTTSTKDTTSVTVHKNDNSSDKTTINGTVITLPIETSVDKKDGTLTTTMSPSFGIGLSYNVKPNFMINLGYSGTIPSITIVDNSVKTKTTVTTYTNTESKEVSNVETTNNTERYISTETGSWESNLYTGFVWGLGKYCNLDVTLRIGREPSLNSVWSAGWNLGFSFKM